MIRIKLPEVSRILPVRGKTCKFGVGVLSTVSIFLYRSLFFPDFVTAYLGTKTKLFRFRHWWFDVCELVARWIGHNWQPGCRNTALGAGQQTGTQNIQANIIYGPTMFWLDCCFQWSKYLKWTWFLMSADMSRPFYSHLCTVSGFSCPRLLNKTAKTERSTLWLIEKKCKNCMNK